MSFIITIKNIMKKISDIYLLIVAPLIIGVSSFLLDVSELNIYAYLISLLIIYSFFFVIYGIFNRIWVAWLCVSIPVLLISIINYYKLIINGTPFLLSDFSFASGLDKILKFALPQIKLSVFGILCIVVYVGFTILLIFAEKHFKKKKRVRQVSIVAGLLVCIVLFFPYTHKIIAGFGYENSSFSETLILKHGVITGMYCSGAEIEKAAYSQLNKDDIDEVIKKQKASAVTDDKPTVIFLMSESFFDIDKLDNVSFSEDPIKNFHTLKKQFSSGNFVSNTYKGGTGYVEFEVLTGICGHLLKLNDPIDNLPDETYKKIPCISDIFKKNNYCVKFLHSYDNSLFNRSAIYKNFNFDEIRFAQDFKTTPKYSGGYLSDETLVNEIISIYEEPRNEPLMLYAVSMENHQPYTVNKYNGDCEIEIFSDVLTENDKNIFGSYIQGLHNADKALGRLIDYFSDIDEPVMIVFFGDHLPSLNLGNNSDVYRKLNYSPQGESYEWKGEELLKMLSTDYVVWDNFNLKKKDMTIGCTMFGVEIVDRLGLEMTDYYKWLSKKVKDDYLIYRSRVFASNKDIYDAIPKKHKKMMDDYSTIVRDIVYGESHFFGIPQR